MLRVQDLSAGYKSREVLHNISLQVGAGQIGVLLGANGAGKTTALGAIIGTVRRFSGSISLGEADITANEVAANVQAGLALVPEGARVFRDLSVYDNLILGAYTVRQSREIADRIEGVIKVFPILGQRLRQLGGTLSGGERQMLAIGRALMSDPRVILLDEPYLGLAPSVVEIVTEAIVRLNRERQITFLIVEQNTKVLSIASVAFVMQLGEIVIEEYDPDTLLNDDRLRNSFIA